MMITADAVVIATVEALDLDKRVVTLREDDGTVSTLYVSDQVRNLAQVKIGDRVDAMYEESIAVRVEPVPEGQ